MLTDLGIVALLLLMNGFFAMAELAIVSARRPRLRQMAEEGKGEGAKKALELAEDPSSFLSVVQIGVTLNSILTGAFSGATLAEPFGAYLNTIPQLAPHGEAIALAVTVASVTYLSLIIGELVPKRIGLSYAEPIAVRLAGFMQGFAILVSPIVWILRFSTDLLLKLLRLDKQETTAVTEDEVKSMIAEGTESGVFMPAEKKMLEGVMRLTDRSVRTIMTPRIDVAWLGIEDKIEDSLKIIRESGNSRFPVARGDMEEVLGVVYAKDLLNAHLHGKALNLSSVMRQPLVVPDTTPVMRLLDQFKQSRQHLAIVIDEYGSVEGLVTLTDILEAIIGDVPEVGQSDDGKPVRRTDGSWLIDGMMPIDEVETLIHVKGMRDGEGYHTIAGFVIGKLGRIPKAGDFFHFADARFEVMDMDGRRVDKVLVNPPANDDEDEID